MSGLSMHACEWASEKGREMKLSCPERVTLWQLARRSASKGFCWPSLTQLRDDTGLARQTILTVVRRLAALELIRIEKDGQKQFYHLIRPVQNETDRSKSEPVTGLNLNPNRSKKAPPTGLNLNPNLKENQKENLKGTEAAGSSVPAATGQRSDGAPAAATSQPDETHQPVADAAKAVAASVVRAWRGDPVPGPAIITDQAPPPRRGPVDAIRTPDEQLAILHAMIADEALAKAVAARNSVP